MNLRRLCREEADSGILNGKPARTQKYLIQANLQRKISFATHGKPNIAHD